ncbi:MAG: methionyl-tRNA formyltransferase [Alphaproteobacteria bacterium]|nr:methionyl-tRNA formyltransferase [Alphaproteobacteria bacterium]
MGSPEFSVSALSKLIEAGHEIVAVYCQPPRAKDRGHTVQKGAVHLAAEALNLSVYTPKSLKGEEEQAIFKSHNADVAVVAAYGLILPKVILEAPKLGCINIHASLLPRWRGAAPIHRAILEGDKETGITIMQMDEGLDTGDILSMQSLPITQSTTTPTLHDQLSKLGAELIVKTLENLSTITPTPQPAEGVTYAHKLVKSEGHLDWNLPAVELKRKIAALNPWPGTWFDHKDIPIKVLEASVISQKGKPGEFLQTLDHSWVVCCSEGALSLEKVQKPGSKPLSTLEFLRGYPVF